MKKTKSFLALCAALTVLLAGCGDSGTPNSSVAPSSGESSTGSVQPSGESSSEMVSEYPESLRIWAGSFAGQYSAIGAKDYNVNASLQKICENTGTELIWEYGSSGNDWMTNFNLMLSSGDYPDIIVYDWKSIPGGAAQYAKEGVIIDLTDLYQSNLSNVYHALENVDSVNNVKTADGRMYYVPEIFDRPGGGIYQGFVIRQDMLDEMNEPIPTTLDEYHALLKKAKEKYGDGFYPMTGVGFNNVLGIGSLLWAYGITYDFYLEGEKVCYGPLSDRFADGMEYIHTLYAEGLIDPDYATQDRAAEKGKIMSDQSMVTFEYQPSGMMEAMAEQNPDFKLVGIPDLKETPDAPPYTFNQTYLNNIQTFCSYAISTNCKEPEKAANFINYIFSEEGAQIANWGEEGVDFEYGPDNKPQFTKEYLMMDDSGKTSRVFGTVSAFASLRILDAYQAILPEVSVQAIETWVEKDDTSRILPAVSLTEDEQDKITDLLADLNTYMGERYSGLVNGQIALDTIPTIQQELKDKMHIEEIIEVYQAAYDRFVG